MAIGYYNIHGLVKFILIGPKAFVNSYRYSKYKTQFAPNREIDFVININKFKPNLHNCVIEDDKYYIKENYLYCKEDSYKILKWEIEFENFENGTLDIKINIKSRFTKLSNASYIIIEGIIIDPIIHFILTKKNCALIHASCVSKDDIGVLFIARGGGGKTTISVKLFNEGFNFLSDNFVILAPDNLAFGFIEPLNIFSYNLNAEIRDALSFSQRIEFELKRYAFILSNQYIKLFVRVSPYQIFSNICEKTTVRSAFVLIPSNMFDSKINISRIQRDDLIKQICYNQMLELPYFDKYLICYSHVFPQSNIFNHWKIYENILDRNLCSEAYKIEMPLKNSYKETKTIVGIINGKSSF